MIFKNIYKLLYSKIGIIIVIALYFILPLPLINSSDIIINKAGQLVGQLLSPLVIVLVLSNFYKWNKNQKILHIFLIAILFEFMLSKESLIPIVNFVSIIAFFILVIQTIAKVFRSKTATNKNDKSNSSEK